MSSDDRSLSDLVTAEEIARRILQGLNAHRSALLATDFDGTVAEISPYPDQVRIDPVAQHALTNLRTRGIPVAVVTGRALADLQSRLALAHGIILVAEHGAIVAYPDGTVETQSPRPEHAAALTHLAARAQDLVRTFPGAKIERKCTSVAIHFRTLSRDDRVRIEPELQALASTAQAMGLQTIVGRSVLEVRLPLADKGTSLARLRDQVAPEGFLVYAGDDTTDEPALALAAKHGAGVYIVSAERSPPHIPGLIVTDRERWIHALASIANALDDRRGISG